MYCKLFSIAALSASVYAQAPIGQLLNSTASLSNLTSLITTYSPQILTTLSSASNITILAPSNAAFAALGPLPNSPDLGKFVTALLTYHVITGSYSASQLSAGTKFLPTLLTDPAYANVTGGQRVESEPMDGSVGFLSGLFKMSMVSQADVKAANNVIVHVIDQVLSIPPPLANATVAGNLTSLAGALTQLNLVETLTDLKDITVFAPTNAAFEAIGSALGTLSTTDLTNILSYHVVKNSVLYSTTLTDGASVPTLAGPNVTVHFVGDKIFVNSAEVIIPDVLVANGVVHVIDQVLNPNNTAGPSSSATAGTPGFSGASSISSAPFTSGVPTPTSALSAPPAPSSSGSGGASGSASGSASGPAVSSATVAAAPPLRTGAVGAAALFGAAGLVALNY